MKSSVQKDKRLRARFLNREAARLSSIALLRNRSVVNRFRLPLSVGLVHSTPVRFKNRCILTGRSGSVYSDFRLSRHSLRESALVGLLSGVFKSSW